MSANYQKSLCVILFVAFCAFATVNTGGETGVVRTLSAKTSGALNLNIGAGVNFAQSSDYVQDQKDMTGANTFWIDQAKLLSTNVYMAMGVTNFLDLALSLPLYYDWAGFPNPDPMKDGGLGDLEVSTKLMLPPYTQDKSFYQSIYVAITAPTGTKNGIFPRHLHLDTDKDTNAANFYTVGAVTVQPMMLFTFDLGKTAPILIHLNLGGVFTEVNKQNTAIGAIAFEYMPTTYFTLFSEFWGESSWDNFNAGYDISQDPLYFSPGVKITTASGMYVYLAGDISLSTKNPKKRNQWITTSGSDQYYYTTGIIPAYGIHFHLGWSGALVPKDSLKDANPDIDKDGICDPWVTEKNVSARYAAVCKGLDKCPTQPEDFDGFQDEDGCPDPDNDRDGIMDTLDKCPNQPETYNGYKDDDGCPDTVPKPPAVVTPPPQIQKKEPDFPKLQTLRGVMFKGATAEITFDSYQWLDPVVKALKEYQDIVIEVRGHTDSMGKYATNMQLSQMRAEAVRQYILNQGIDSQRVRAVGFGPGSPIADNRTAAGRALNRRIEIVRVK